MPVNLSNSTDIVANSVSVIKDNRLVDIIQTITGITGLPPDTLNTLQKIATAIHDNPNFGDIVISALANKQQSLELQAPLIHTTATNASLYGIGIDSTAYASQSNTYTKSQVDSNITTAINALVNGAPDALNTLKELADALNDDSNFATNVLAQINTKQVALSSGSVTNGSTPMMNLQKTIIKNLKGTGKITVSADSDLTTVNIGMSSITKSDVGLSNVDNTSDASKPISSNTQTALDNKQDLISIKTPSGGYPMMSQNNLKGLVASSPITLTSNSDNITIGLNTASLTTNTISPLDTVSNVLNMVGGLVVSGATTFNNNVNVSSTKTLTATTANILGALSVNGATNLYDNTTIGTGKTLTVGGATTLNDNVTIASGKNLTVGGTTTFNDNVFLELVRV